jgi:hypothetical protein
MAIKNKSSQPVLRQQTASVTLRYPLAGQEEEKHFLNAKVCK